MSIQNEEISHYGFHSNTSVAKGQSFFIFLATVYLVFHQSFTVSQFQPTVYSVGVHTNKDRHLVSTQSEETSHYGFHSILILLTQVSYFCYFSLTSSTTCHCEFSFISVFTKLLVLKTDIYGFHSNTSSDQGQSFFSLRVTSHAKNHKRWLVLQTKNPNQAIHFSLIRMNIPNTL